MLEAMGISVEFSHHEGGPGQQEIDLRYADALSTADNIMTFRTVIREVESAAARSRVSASLRSWASSRSHAASSRHCRSRLSRATSTTVCPSRVS